MTSAIGCRDVSVQRSGASVLDGVDLAGCAGEVLAVVGPNGAGKSTLLAVLAGDEVPAAGRAHLGSDATLALTPLARARRRAVLTQQPTIAFGFSVDEVVAMGRAPWSGTAASAEDVDAVADAMAMTGVAHLRDRSATSLSGGEMARVVLARVLAQRCAVLLLDEPTAALDIPHAARTLALVRAQADDGNAVVVVLHDLTAAARCADRVVLLAGGRVVAAGSPTEVIRPEVLSAAYGHRIDVIADPRSGDPIVLPAEISPAALRAR